MATRYFNWKLAIVLVVAAGVFGVAVFALHRWQRSTRAEQALPRGQQAFEQKNWDEAAIQLGRYLAVNTQDVDVLIQFAEAQMNRRPRNQGNVQMAIAAYRNALRLKPDDVDTARRLAELYWDMKAPAEAVDVAERHLARRDDPGLRRALGRALWALREFDRATTEMKTIVEKHPGDIAAYEFLGDWAGARPDVADRPAVAWFDEAVSKNPDSALAYVARAEYHLRAGNRDQAMADLTRAAQGDLSDASVRLRVIGALMNADAWDKAREQLQALEAASPSEAGLWLYWAQFAVKSGSPEEMLAVADRGMKAMEEYPWDFMPSATRLLILSGHMEKVEDYLSRMRERDLDPIMTGSLEGLLAEKQGSIRDAITAWQRVVSRPATTLEQLNVQMQTYIQLATAFSRLNEMQSAISQLQILLSKIPNSVQGRLFLAQLYARTGDWERLQEQASRILVLAENKPGDPVVMEATLLELQAQTNLAGRDTTEDRQANWRRIETRLADLEKASNGAAAVKVLQIQVALAQKKFTEASALLDELEGKNPSDIRLMLLRADFHMAQGQDAQARALFQKAIAAFPQAAEPVQALAVFLDRRDQRAECESVIKEALTRIRDPQRRLNLSLLLAECYRRWQEKEKLCQWLLDLAAEHPQDIQPKRMLLACEQVAQDTGQSQKIIDEIKALEGEKGFQWRYEQARLWARSGEMGQALGKPDPNKPIRGIPAYAQIVKLLQENLLTNAEDQSSRLFLASIYEMAGEQSLALTTYGEAYAQEPNDIRVLVPYVDALQRANAFDQAQEILDKVGRQGLSHPALQRLQLDNDFYQGDLTSASDTLQDLVRQDPNDTTLRLRYARILILRRQFAEAETILTDLRAKEPNSLPVVYAQAGLYLQQGNTEKAMHICNEAVDRLRTAAAYLLRADMFLSLKEYGKVLEDLGQAIALEPQNARTWEARARVYSAIGRTPEAIADVRRAIELAPQDSRIQKRAVVLFLASGSQSLLREAETMLDTALAGRTNPQEKSDPELVLYKARILILRSTGPAIEEARRLLRQVTTDYPKYTDGWELMAQLELQQEEPGRALDHATRGLAYVDSDPNTGEPVRSEKNKRLLLLKAIAEKRLSPSVAALTTLPKLAGQYPDDVGILIEWADAYARANRSEKAVELLNGRLADFAGVARRRCEIALAAALYTDQQREKAKALFDTLITAEPNDPTPVMTLGQLLRKEKRWTEVNQLVNLWRTTNPKDAETSTNMARILAGSGDRQALQMAEDQLRMILDPNPDSVPTLVLLGMLMQDAERNDEATRLNRRILELDPNNVIAINNLAWMLCEQPSASPATVKEALELANRGLAMIPDYMDLLDTRGVVHYRAGELEKSAADLVKCLELFPANAPQSAAPQFHLARTYAAMNRRTEAVEHLKIALSLNGRNVQLARDHAEAGRMTHAIKVLRDALSLQEQMDQFKTGFDQQDLVGVRSAGDWTEARLLLDQLQKGQK